MKYTEILELIRKEGSVVCRLPANSNPQWAVFSSPQEILKAYNINDISSILNKIDTYHKKGGYAAGFIAYEAAAAFDKANKVKENNGSFPLAYFGLYDKASLIFSGIEDFEELIAPPHLESSVTKEIYDDKIAKIKSYICNGDIYQANYTLRFRGERTEDPFKLFIELFISHPVPYAAFVNTGDCRIISLSPELFMERDGKRIVSSPMKGTAPADGKKDLDDSNIFEGDMKNLAENLMITDMVRNDLGRICEFGTVKAEKLFAVESFRTVKQMISTISGILKDEPASMDIFKAMFPPASITGAPKIRAMEIITETEDSPRKIYTGSIGCFAPENKFCFNVAIRTIAADKKNTELGLGGGIVADSEADSEWQECLIKKSFIHCYEKDFLIIETILWEKEHGFYQLDAHITRAMQSAEYFGFIWDKAKLAELILKLSDELNNTEFARVRFAWNQSGEISFRYSMIEKPGWGKEQLNLAVSVNPTNSQNLFLRHKTDRRKFYDSEFAQCLKEGFDEIIFFNERGELTEGAISNIFIYHKEKWRTPALECGLLNGIWRASMINELNAEETVLRYGDLESAEKIIIGNSVRKTGFVFKLSYITYSKKY